VQYCWCCKGQQHLYDDSYDACFILHIWSTTTGSEELLMNCLCNKEACVVPSSFQVHARHSICVQQLIVDCVIEHLLKLSGCHDSQRTCTALYGICQRLCQCNAHEALSSLQLRNCPNCYFLQKAVMSKDGIGLAKSTRLDTQRAAG